MKYKLAIFDLDGTILNTLDDLVDSTNYVLKKYNYPQHTTEQIKYMVGNGIPKLIERALPKEVTETEYKSFYKDFVAYYDQHCADKTAPYVHMVEALKTLKQAGLKLAVNSNKLHAASVLLCNQYFPGIFDYICGNQPGIGVKPSSDGVHLIMKELSFDSSDCSQIVYIGDSDVDCQTAQNSNISFIGCDWGFRGEVFLREHGAKIVIKSPLELVELCK